MRNYKVETKGSLWEVYLSHGEYSDSEEYWYVFSGNSREEIWAFVKQWAEEGGTGDTESYDKKGMILNENTDKGRKEIDRFQFRKTVKGEGSMDWDSGYGDAYDVSIKRLDVIYVNPIKKLTPEELKNG